MIRHCLIADGHNLYHRMLHAPGLKELRSSEGESTGVTYGVLRAIRNALAADPAERVLLVNDGALSERRLALHPGYKESRRGKRIDRDYLEDFITNKERLAKLLPALGVAVIQLDREADDVIAHLASERELSGARVTILSEDKDLCQLVSDRVQVLRPIAEQRVRPDNFVECIGYPSHLYLLAKAILGDSSDDIPGVRGTGEVAVAEITKAIADLVGFSDGYGTAQAVSFCKGHKAKRIRQVSEEANIKIVERNLKMIDLSLERLDDVEVRRVRELLEDMPAANPERALKHVRACELSSLEREWELFVRPFERLNPEVV